MKFIRKLTTPLLCRLIWLGTFSFLLGALANLAEATPILALKEAENCKACHNPGRRQLPVLERRCSLDCVGCHVDPSGAGPRNMWGKYYQYDQLNAVHFFKPVDPLKDTSRYDVHYDGRVINHQTADRDRTFPMSSEISVRARPFIEYLHLTYQAVFLGRIGDQVYRADRSDDRRFREKYSIMIDKLPMNLYARWYRGAPMYGLRRPNHSLWIRERIGLDQFAMTEAMEFGGTPNVPFLRGSVMDGDPYKEPEDRQKGTSSHFGFRGVSYGWHINGSTWDTESEKNKISMRALGAGASPWHLLFMAERNWRKVTEKEEIDPTQVTNYFDRVHPSSQIDEFTAAFTGIPGVIVGHVYEELHDEFTDSHRRSYFMDFHPMPFLQFEIWRRFEGGSRELADYLGIVHLYADF